MFTELGEGVYTRRYDSLDLNVGVVVGEDGVLIVDTRESYPAARKLLADLVTLTRKRVNWVVNTHYHWDHVFGNALFPKAAIWGHERCREVLIKHGDEMKDGAKAWLTEDQRASIDEVEIVPPTETFSDRASIAIGRAIDLSFHGLAHTDSDILVGVPDAGVSFAGDIIEESAPPAFGDSFPLTWPLTLRLAADEMHDVIVPGHGGVVGHEFVHNQHSELVSVAELAASVVNEEMAIDDAADAGPYPKVTMTDAIQRALATV